MKHIITAVILSTAAFAHAEEKSVGEKVRDKAESVAGRVKEVTIDTTDAAKRIGRKAAREARAAWVTTKEAMSDQLPVYRGGAVTTLADLGRDIVMLKSQTPPDAPRYYRTRIQSLDEQLELLTNRLAVLSFEQFQVRTSGPRIDFDRCVADLEQAIGQAENGSAVMEGSILMAK